MQTDCPNRQITSFDGEDCVPSYDESGDEGEVSDDNAEIAYADSGTTLVVRRVFNVTVAEDEQWLRHNIFHTK